MYSSCGGRREYYDATSFSNTQLLLEIWKELLKRSTSKKSLELCAIERRIKLVKLGILDYAQIDEGTSAQAALQNTITLAQLAETLGYERFWMAEHHNVPAFASSAPELIMMRLADATKHIRIGSGGVMLPHYSPYKVAENFRVLEAFHPNRIDLGMGNTIGTSIVNRTLNENKKGKLNYEQSIVDLTKYLSDQVDENHRFHGITANPVISTVPQMWVLSTSVRNAKMAAKLGVGYTFGLFPLAGIDKLNIGIHAAKTYREEFKPSPFMPEPRVSIAPFVVVAETNEQAEAYAESLDLWLLGTDNFGELREFPSVETARHYPYTEEEKAIIQANRTRMVVGDIENVTAQLNELITQFRADELLLIPLLPGLGARKKAIELLAGAFN